MTTNSTKANTDDVVPKRTDRSNNRTNSQIKATSTTSPIKKDNNPIGLSFLPLCYYFNT